MDSSLRLPSKLMVVIALAQGFCLLYLHQAIELGYWLYQQPQLLFACYSVALIWPTMLLLALSDTNRSAIIKLTLPFILLSALLSYYVGSQSTPVEHMRYGALLFSFVLTMVIATFKALMYIQQLALAKPITYSALFLWSWRNFLTLSLALLFTGCFWLILLLWGALFDAIDINFFGDLFEKRWFYYPTLALANAFGIIIFRKLSGVIDTIARLQQALMKFLLVVLVLVSLLFLTALPFTGLDPLWQSGGSSLILWMQALLLFFVSAVYQDEPENWPYTLWFHRFIGLGLAVLPIYSLISFYGLNLRIEQYGWSLARYWAFLAWGLLALFPLGYWWGIAKYRDDWVQQLSRVNVAMGLMVLTVMLLVNTPLLDFRKMVVANQMQRLADNKIAINDFDIRYFHHYLAKPGYDALQSLKAQYADTQPSLLVRINALYADRDNKNPSSTRDEFIAAIKLLSDNPPDLLMTTIYENAVKQLWHIQQIQSAYLRALDADDDGVAEYLWITQTSQQITINLYFLEDERWQSLPVSTSWKTNDEITLFLKSVTEQKIEAVPSRWNDIIIGSERYNVNLIDSHPVNIKTTVSKQ